MRLDAGLVERGGPAADGHIRVLAEKEVHLLERAAVGLDTIEAAHINDGWCHLDKLVHAWNVLAGRLPHVPVNEGKFDFSCHNIITFCKQAIACK